MKPKRWYLHGDIHEDGKRYYDARKDSFEPLPPPPATALDVDRYKRDRKSLQLASGKGRPENAPNLFSDHVLLKAHPSTLRAAVKKEREKERLKKR